MIFTLVGLVALALAVAIPRPVREPERLPVRVRADRRPRR